MVKAKFTFQTPQKVNASFSIGQRQSVGAGFSADITGTHDHDALFNRDLPDQHPIEAITNLENVLSGLTSGVSTLQETIGNFGDVVTHNTDYFATAEQGALADSALQSGDNITELVNNANYAKEGFVNFKFNTLKEIIDGYGDIVTHDTDEFATAQQGQLADTALQSGDNISELTNNVHYATESFVEDKIEDVTDTFGDIVSHNVSEFATSAQGALADTALQPNDDISELTNDVGYITSASLPTVNNGGLTIQKNGSDLGTFRANQATNTTVNVIVPTQASDVNALPDTTTISDLVSTAQLNALNSGATTTNIGQITTNENDISDINAKIPSQASSSNQLADKSFVNSSIATNTAYFIGTFNSVAELEAYSGTLTNNDYAFVQTTDTAGNTLYDRYKWNGSEWLFEYELNNSSFTASQWAAINSGATAEKLADYVTTNTAQTITSQKTFSSAIRRSSTIDQSATTGSKEVRFLDELDSENQSLAYWQAGRSTTTNTSSQRINNKNVSGANWASLNISANDAGQAWASINCGSGLSNRSVNEVTTSFSSTIIPTMGWVNNPNYSQNVLHRTGAETATGNKTFSGTVSFTGTATATTQATSDSSTKLATTAFVNNAMSSFASLPSGVILPFGGSSAPTGFLICDGSAVSRTDYADLFDVIGTTYGSGDGSTTFNLPNLSSGVLPNSSTVDVVGNGNALGIVDDISSETAQHNALVVGQGSGFSNARVPFSAFNLNTPLAIGSTSTATEFGTNNKALGVSTLPEWSGLTGSISGVSVNYIIKV